MLITLIGRLVQFVLMFASVKIMTHLLTPAEMGKVALITTTTSLFALFLVNPVGMFINRRMHAWVDAGSFRSYFRLFVGYLVAVSLVAAVALLAGYHLGLDLGGARLPWALALVCGSLLFNTIATTLVQALNMVQRVQAFTVLTLGTLITSLGLSVWLNHATTPSGERWLAGTLLGQTLFGLIAYVVFFYRSNRSNEPLRIGRAQWTAMLSFCWPIGVAVLLQWLHMQGYRFLLAERFGLAQLGLYAAGYGVAASLISAMETLLTTWYQPIFYRMANSTDAAQRDQAWSVYASVMLPVSALGMTALVAVSPSLPKVLLGAAFHDAGRYVLLGALAEWARMLVGLVGLNAHRHMSTRRLIMPNLLGMIATYLVLLATITPLGLLAAPVAMFAGSCTVIAYLWLHTYRDDPHATLAWRPIAGCGTVAVVAAALFVALQTALPIGVSPAAALGVCLAVGLVWTGLGGLAVRQGLLKLSA
jgi:O-antigen/teichoic acid export membrane protein